MATTTKLKSLDFYRKIPRDLTEASLSGAGLSLIAAFAMILLFGMELSSYLRVSTTTTVVVDRSKDGEYLRIHFNMSFPALSCEFASVDVSDILGTNRVNLTKTIRKFAIDPKLNIVGSALHSGPLHNPKSHGDDEEILFDHSEGGAVALTTETFDKYVHQFPVLVVNFYAPWCYWSNRLKPSWEKAAKIMAERYDPEDDGRILLTKVDCTEFPQLCKSHHVQGFPSIRIFRKGHDVRGDEHGHHDHESYYGERDTDSIVAAMETYVKGISQLALEDKSVSKDNATVKRPAPRTSGCRIEGFVRVKKVPGNLVIAARSGSHSFDASAMNLTHYVDYFDFGREFTWSMKQEIDRIYPILDTILQESPERHLRGKLYTSEHENVTHEHYIQVVKTEVVSLRKKDELKLLDHYDYTAHSSVIQSTEVPVVKFHYELSPMQVLVKENSKSFSHFVTNVCAIIGGVFTVAGIIDSMLHNAIRIVKKIELGKQF